VKALAGATIAVVGALRAEALARAGAVLVELGPEEFWVAHEPSYDLVVLGSMPGDRAAAFLAELRADPKTRSLSRLAVVDGDTAARLVKTGPIAIVDAGASDTTIVQAAAEMIGSREGVQDARIAALEDQLRSTAGALEEHVRARSVLVHDLRALLAIVVGFGGNLRDGFAGEIGPVARESVERMIAAANDASALLERYSTGSLRSVEGGARGSAPPRRAVRRSQVEVGALVREIASLLTDTARESRVALDASCEPVVAWCDALQIKQSVLNLLVNALKFTPPGGRVHVSTRRSAPEAGHGASARSGIEIVVADSGPGVPEADRERIFERGVRLDRDAGIAGRGIGLAVVREVAIAHGGSVHVEPGPLGGAAFVLRIPTDLRRRENGVLVVKDSAAARDLCALLSSSAPGELDVVNPDDPRFASAAAACALAVVVSSSTELDALIERLRGAS
jgi:signal transduction histidine kinase